MMSSGDVGGTVGRGKHKAKDDDDDGGGVNYSLSNSKHRKLNTAAAADDVMIPLPEDPEAIARSYQLEALEKAIKRNTIVFLDTGSGKTLIAVMLLRAYSHLIRKPSNSIAFFLVPTVVLVSQQADVIEMHTDLKVGRFWGDMGVDFWDIHIWQDKLRQFQVFVTTPQILVDCLRHSFFKLEDIRLLIFDECHHAKGRHPYACIMTEFYHKILKSSLSANLPRIFGMTASLIKSKGFKFHMEYEKQIRNLENLMNSKVYTIANESVLSDYIWFPTTKMKMYEPIDIPSSVYFSSYNVLAKLKDKHLCSLKHFSSLEASIKETAAKKIEKLHYTFLFCVTEFGLWLASKAAEIISCKENHIYLWGDVNDGTRENFIQNYSKDVFSAFSQLLPTDIRIGRNFHADISAGFLTRKIECLILSLLEYRLMKQLEHRMFDLEELVLNKYLNVEVEVNEGGNLRCIIFVERVITAIVLPSLLSAISELTGWESRYMAGNCSGLKAQSRKEHISILDSFCSGKILEEGLDVRSCNLVIRFDQPTTVSSFIQSRGRARMHGSDYVVLIRRGDSSSISRLSNFLTCGDTMRQESLQLASVPCASIQNKMCDEPCYSVETTGAIVTLSSSVQLIYFYCSRLPSDKFFKPFPRFVIDESLKHCTLHLPKSCSIPPISAEGNHNLLKKLVCLEACKLLHQRGDLNDSLLPVYDVEADEDTKKFGNDLCSEMHDRYFPQELVESWESFSATGLHYCYRIAFLPNFSPDISTKDIIFVVKCDLGTDFSNVSFNLETDWGYMTVRINFIHTVHLSKEEILMARIFQSKMLNISINRCYDKLKYTLDDLFKDEVNPRIAYLLLPSIMVNNHLSIDWDCVKSAHVTHEDISNLSVDEDSGVHHCSQMNCRWIQTKQHRVRSCMIQNSVVYTPHNNIIYSISGILHELNGNSTLKLKGEYNLTYEEFYKSRHGITLLHTKESLLSGRHVVIAQNYLARHVYRERGTRTGSVELPPELCVVLLSPISPSIIYSFSFIPSVMYRIESILLASRLNIHSNCCMQNGTTLSMKLLEAVTTKKCREKFSLETLETLGDSFLKYAASLHLFESNWDHHEGILSAKKDRIVSNLALYQLGFNRKLPGFIRNEEFDPKAWVITHNSHVFLAEDKTCFSGSVHVYNVGTRCFKFKRVADVVEALIGAYLTFSGEIAALAFLNWLGMDLKLNFNLRDERSIISFADKYVNVKLLESLLNYQFHDPSLLVEALTHGSYQVSAVPRCYQRLEFLGDAVLDHLITVHMYNNYPNLLPGLLTDLRSAQVNNDCYAHAAVKAGLNKHILHASLELHRQITIYLNNFPESFSETSYGWKSGTALPKVLGDVIESIAGAILVDSGYKKEAVWESIRPLLEPLVTPDTIEYHPVKELHIFCSRKGYRMKFFDQINQEDEMPSLTVEIEAEDGFTIQKTCTATNKRTAKRLAAKAALDMLKERVSSSSGTDCIKPTA